MIPLPRELLVAHALEYKHRPVSCTQYPIQLGLPGAWRVVVGSIIMQRIGDRAARQSIQRFFAGYKAPEDVTDVFEVARLLSKSALRQRKARNLVAMSKMWLTTEWTDLRELPGCGLYVCDAVSIFCFGGKQLASNDKGLRAYLQSLEVSKRFESSKTGKRS